MGFEKILSVVMIIVVVAAVVLLLFGVSRVTAVIPQLKGAGFERSVSGKLRRLPEEYRVIDNVVFVSNGASTQIDHIVVSPYGVFVIEAKGYKGWITGGEGRCPRCGGELVRREGRYGSFCGCSNYPSCKYILKGRDRYW